MNVLCVLSHPRRNSLSGAVLDAFVEGLTEAGHRAEIADLHAEGFDPVLRPDDEPDWDDSNKRYSDAVHREMARIERNDAIALVFPIWWWSMPAMLKGWIDRVWNNGWAYGDRKLTGKRAIAIAIAGASHNSYVKREYDRAMEIQIRVGIFKFCGIEDARLHMMYDSFEDEATTRKLVEEARELGRGYP